MLSCYRKSKLFSSFYKKGYILLWDGKTSSSVLSATDHKTVKYYPNRTVTYQLFKVLTIWNKLLCETV